MRYCRSGFVSLPLPVSAALLGIGVPTPAHPTPELVVVNAKVATSDAEQPSATGFAVEGGRFVYVGDAARARSMAGPNTLIVDLRGSRVIPGLVDAHVHPLGIVDLDVCDLKSEPKTLAQIADVVRGCIVRYRPKPGEWLSVTQWNFSNGNQTDARFRTLRAALDSAAPDNPVTLLGNDGHHGAYNSLALKRAAGRDGKVIGLSKATLAGPFAAYRQLVAVDSAGEPSGGVNEAARALLGGKAVDVADVAGVMKAPEKVMERLNSVGITAFLDAAAEPGIPVYDTLQERGQLTAHVSLAQLYDPDVITKADGTPDYDRMVADAATVRDRYAKNPLIRADTVKLFADGVLEGDPLAVPPTLPNSPSLAPYHQPVFDRDKNGAATFSGRYVDLTSPVCNAARADRHDVRYGEAFVAKNGFHPAQCAIDAGKLQHSREVTLEFVRRMHKAGLSLHIHAIGDRAVRTALDAIEAARIGDSRPAMRADTLAHLQLVSPDDQARIGRMKLFLAMTYAWFYTDREYDLSVIPFVQKVTGDSYAALHVPGSYYEANAYPARAMQQAGGVLVAGSDAPVETRDPRPFFNMATAMTRARGGTPPLGPADQQLSITDVLRAYTIDGARSLGREAEFGSISIGKSADFVVLDRDLLAIAPEAVAATRVTATWFQGRRVFTR